MVHISNNILISKVRIITKTATVRHSSITFFSTFVNALLGAIFYILTARFLGPELFGVMSVSIAVMTLVSDIGDLGVDTGLVNFVSKYITTDVEKAKIFLRYSLLIKITVSLIVFIVGYFISPFIANYIFNKPGYTSALRLSFVGVSSVLLFSYLTSSLQAMQSFWKWGGVMVATNALRLVVVIIIYWLNSLTVISSLVVYISVPLLGFLIGLQWLPRGFMKVTGEKKVVSDIFHYNKWVASFTFLAAISARVDTLITTRILTEVEIGFYQLATQMVKIIPQINVALGTVIAPKLASKQSIKEFLTYFKKSQLYVLGISALLLLSIPVAIFLIPYVFGVEYLEVKSVFILLFISMLIFLISAPIHLSIFYYFNYPKIFFFISLTNLILVVSLGSVLIPIYRTTGAAITVLISQIINLIAPGVWLYKKVNSEK